MKKFLIVSLLFFYLLIPKGVVNASGYSCFSDFNVNVGDGVRIKQIVKVQNLNEKNLLSEVSFVYPFDISEIQIFLNDEKLDKFHYVDRKLTIFFTSQYIKPKEEKTFTIYFYANDLLKKNTVENAFIMPRVNFCEGNGNIDINYEEEILGPISYKSVTSIKNDSAIISSTNNKYELDINWNWINGKYMPLPSNLFNNVNYVIFSKPANVVKDDLSNEFMAFSKNSFTSGEIKGSLVKKEEIKDLPELEDKYYTNNFTIPDEKKLKSSTLKEKYDELLGFGFDKYKNSKEVNNDFNDSFSAALIWAIALEGERLKPYILFGPVKALNSEEIFWGYWVGVFKDEKFVQYDIFFDSVFEMRAFDTVTPNRQIWGIITKDNIGFIKGLDNIHNLDKQLKPQNNESHVLGDNIDIDALLVVHKSKISLTIDNNSNGLIFIEKLIAEGKEVLLDEKLGIIPNSHKTIDITDKIIDSNTKIKEGVEYKLSVLRNGSDLEVGVITKKVDDVKLFTILFYSSLIFFALVLFGIYTSIESVNKYMHIIWPRQEV